MEGEQPQLVDLLTMVINHLLTGMILQVEPPMTSMYEGTQPLKTRPFPSNQNSFRSWRGSTCIDLALSIFLGCWLARHHKDFDTCLGNRGSRTKPTHLPRVLGRGTTQYTHPPISMLLWKMGVSIYVNFGCGPLPGFQWPQGLLHI